jgi:hypothetical protein
MTTRTKRTSDAELEILPNFSETARSPRIPERPGEIVLAVEAPRESRDGPVWPLRGSFRMPAGADSGESLLRRVVLALTSGASHVTQARHAFGNVVLFGADVTGAGSDLTGFFNVDLADLFELSHRRETFHIVASIGTHTSDVLTCDAEFPWIEAPRAEPLAEEAASEEDEDEDDEEDEEEDDDSWMVDDDPEP